MAQTEWKSEDGLLAAAESSFGGITVSVLSPDGEDVAALFITWDEVGPLGGWMLEAYKQREQRPETEERQVV